MQPNNTSIKNQKSGNFLPANFKSSLAFVIPVLLIVIYPLLVHFSILLNWPHLQIVAVVAVLLGVFWIPLSKRSRRAWIIFCATIAALIVLSYWDVAFYLLYFPPIIFPCLLLFIFARTLVPGNEPLITAIGESARGPLSASMRKYTRGLTIVWCVIFFMMITWAIILPWVQKKELWSWVTNVINYGFVGVMFVGEFILRKKLFPEHNHPSFIEYIKIIIRYNIAHR